MSNYYVQVLGIADKINELNDKLNNFSTENMDNIWVGVAIMGVLLVLAVWGINTLNKK